MTLSNPELYSTANRSAVAGPAMTQVRTYQTATCLANGKVLMIGGANHQGLALASAELYE